MSEIVIDKVENPEAGDLFKLRFSRIIAGIFCKMGIHHNWILVDPVKGTMQWYCSFCGHHGEKIENVTIKEKVR